MAGLIVCPMPMEIADDNFRTNILESSSKARLPIE